MGIFRLDWGRGEGEEKLFVQRKLAWPVAKTRDIPNWEEFEGNTKEPRAKDRRGRQPNLKALGQCWLLQSNAGFLHVFFFSHPAGLSLPLLCTATRKQDNIAKASSPLQIWLQTQK